MTTIALRNATLIDGTGAGPSPRTTVLVEDNLISRVGPDDALTVPAETEEFDLGGMTLLPGLTDAHVHFGLHGVNRGAGSSADDNLTTYVLDVIENIEIALDEGFTTVRDAAGLDPAFAMAVEHGRIQGPRILPSGSALSITGGHGDQRGRYETAVPQSVPGVLAAFEICDGVDAVRAAARRQLRLGATQIKMMASGGVMSQMDELESIQFTVEEMAAAVYEARATGKYVLTHCHTSPSINNSLDAGVRSIEHGSILDEPTAARIAEMGAFMVPTLVTLEMLLRQTDELAVSHYSLMKLGQVKDLMPVSVELAAHSGVNVGSGSDLLGLRQTGRGEEISLKSKIIGPMQAIVSATSVNARLFQLEDTIGIVREGMEADMVAVSGDPLTDLELFTDPSNVRLVVKAGRVVRDTR